jgi:predicted nucleotidyltransferase
VPLTARQQALTEAIVRVLSADPAIEAAWLGGSLGRGGGDAYSDVDVVALVGDGSAAEAGLRHAGAAERIAPPVLVNRLFGGRILNVVTEDWDRFDISFVEPAELARFHAGRLVELFNRGDRRPPAGEPPAYVASRETVLPLVNEFLRVLGLLPLGVGREEWLVAMAGVGILRQLTLDLMLEENGVGPGERGGALRRNPLLTPQQRATLEGLSPGTASRAGVIEPCLQLAAVFLPRARSLAARVGATWPEAFEAATRRHLKAQLGVELDQAGASIS